MQKESPTDRASILYRIRDLISDTSSLYIRKPVYPVIGLFSMSWKEILMEHAMFTGIQMPIIVFLIP